MDKLHRAIVDAVASDEFRNRVSADAIVPASNTPAEFDALIKRDHAVWGDLVRKLGGINGACPGPDPWGSRLF